jgi:hypothetical protein
MLSCPREILAQFAPNPAEMRALHRTCRAIAAVTRRTFYRAHAYCDGDWARWSTLQIHGTYTHYAIEFDIFGRTIWTKRDFDGDGTPFTLMPGVNMWDRYTTVDNMLFARVDTAGATEATGTRVKIALASDRETVEQFVGIYIDRLYAVVGFYNNFRGIDYNDVSADASASASADASASACVHMFAVMDDRGKWSIRATNVSLHLLRGTVLALELMRD